METIPLLAIYLFLILEAGKFYLIFLGILIDNIKNIFIPVTVEFLILTTKVYLFYKKSMIFPLLILVNLIINYAIVVLNPALERRTNEDYLKRIFVSPDNNKQEAVMFNSTYSIVLFSIYYVNTI